MSAWKASVKARQGSFSVDLTMKGTARATAIIGPNGSGKTTFLRLFLGAIKASQAKISIGERIICNTESQINLPIEQRRIGYVPQGTRLFPHLNALDNVAFGLSTGGRKQALKTRRSLSRQLLTKLACAELAHRSVDNLSGGEKKKIALARALIINPEIVLLDEPLASLDAINRRSIRQFLASTLESIGRPIIFTTHDVRDISALNAQIYALEAGKVVQAGSLDELRQAPASPFISEFLGSSG